MQRAPSGRVFLLTSLICGLACGPASGIDVELETPFMAGERLRPVVYDSGADTQVLVRWHDTQLELDCDVTYAADGRLRCVPGEFQSEALFSDPDCIEPAHRHLCGEASVPAAVRRQHSPPCGSETEYDGYRVGASLGEHPVYVRQPHGACLAIGSANLFALEHIEPDEMVAFDVRMDERGSSLDVSIHRGEDGSHGRGSLHDRDLGRECGAWGWWGRDPRCLAIDRALVNSQYRDSAACDAGIVATHPESCPDPAVVVRPEDAEAFAVGRRLEATEVYFESAISGECEDLESSSGQRFYAAGAAVDLARLPPIEVRQSGTTRLRPLTVSVPEGPEVPTSPVWWDDELEMHCAVQSTKTSGLRCLPVDPMGWPILAVTAWADSDCSRDRVARLLTSAVSGLNAGLLPTTDASDVCADPAGVVTLGEAHSGPVYRLSMGQCTEWLDPPSGFRFVEREAALQELPTVELRMVE